MQESIMMQLNNHYMMERSSWYEELTGLPVKWQQMMKRVYAEIPSINMYVSFCFLNNHNDTRFLMFYGLLYIYIYVKFFL